MAGVAVAVAVQLMRASQQNWLPALLTPIACGMVNFWKSDSRYVMVTLSFPQPNTTSLMRKVSYRTEGKWPSFDHILSFRLHIVSDHLSVMQLENVAGTCKVHENIYLKRYWFRICNLSIRHRRWLIYNVDFRKFFRFSILHPAYVRIVNVESQFAVK